MNNSALPLVTFEQAKRLKAAGFDWPCERYYHIDSGSLDDDADRYEYNWNSLDHADLGERLRGYKDVDVNVCSAPAVALVLKWMRDVKDMPCGVAPYYKTDIDTIVGVGWYYLIGEDESREFDTYEAAESALLDELLTLLENGK